VSKTLDHHVDGESGHADVLKLFDDYLANS
jgi:hypothetical protein